MKWFATLSTKPSYWKYQSLLTVRWLISWPFLNCCIIATNCTGRKHSQLCNLSFMLAGLCNNHILKYLTQWTPQYANNWSVVDNAKYITNTFIDRQRIEIAARATLIMTLVSALGARLHNLKFYATSDICWPHISVFPVSWHASKY